VLGLLAACSPAANGPPGSAPGPTSGGAASPTAVTGSDAPAATEPPASGDAGTTALCDYLSADEIAGVVGNDVAPGVESFGSCAWSAGPDDTSVSMTRLAVSQAQCAQAAESDAGQVAVEGLPVPAFWAGAVGVGSLSLCMPDSMLILTVTAGLDDPVDDSVLRAQAEDLAALALDG
jgi:hypothetical protein